MVSTRGVKFKFSQGERVLCYEPDPTKARVLYESKVLDLVVSRDERGRKVPEYKIHFFGWNSSWDRCVKEEYILPFTDENRELQERLAEEAALSLKGKRKGKLYPLVKDSSSKKSYSENGEDQMENALDQSDSGSERYEEEMEVEIEIPEVLKRILEDDLICITQRDKFIKIPCEYNIISILEDYVKHLAANLLCASPPKNAKNGKQLMPEDVKNELNLCKETMDGIRVCFDFTLPHLLLYHQEKKQYYTVGTSCHPIRFVKKQQLKEENNIKMELDPDANGIQLLTKDIHPMKLEVERLSSRSLRGRHSIQSECIKSPIMRIEKSSNSSPKTPNQPISNKRPRGRPRSNTTRILRSTDKQKTEPSNDTEASNSSLPPRIDETSSPLNSEPLICLSPSRLTRKSLANSSPPQIINPSVPSQHQLTSAEKIMSNSSTSSQSNQPPPTLSIISTHISSSNSSTDSSVSTPLLQGQQYHLINNSGVLQEVLSWHMLPDYVYEETPAAPSLIYGAHHLLRLFVKLPELISKMNMAHNKLILLLNNLHKFLFYLVEKRNELFLSSAYIDAKEIFPDLETTKTN